MKKIGFIFLFIGLASVTKAQLTPKKPKCGTFAVNILDGNVNGIKPWFSIGEIKAALPCFTSVEEENAGSKCGGGVFYKDHDVYFYTLRDYVEIGEKFDGTLSLPLMGAKRNSLFKWLGNPKVSDDTWDAFQTAYGTLVLHYNTDNNVKLIQFSSKGTETLSLCE